MIRSIRRLLVNRIKLSLRNLILPHRNELDSATHIVTLASANVFYTIFRTKVGETTFAHCRLRLVQTRIVRYKTKIEVTSSEIVHMMSPHCTRRDNATTTCRNVTFW